MLPNVSEKLRASLMRVQSAMEESQAVDTAKTAVAPVVAAALEHSDRPMAVLSTSLQHAVEVTDIITNSQNVQIKHDNVSEGISVNNTTTLLQKEAQAAVWKLHDGVGGYQVPRQADVFVKTPLHLGCPVPSFVSTEEEFLHSRLEQVVESRVNNSDREGIESLLKLGADYVAALPSTATKHAVAKGYVDGMLSLLRVGTHYTNQLCKSANDRVSTTIKDVMERMNPNTLIETFFNPKAESQLVNRPQNEAILPIWKQRDGVGGYQVPREADVLVKTPLHLSSPVPSFVSTDEEESLCLHLEQVVESSTNNSDREDIASVVTVGVDYADQLSRYARDRISTTIKCVADYFIRQDEKVVEEPVLETVLPNNLPADDGISLVDRLQTGFYTVKSYMEFVLQKENEIEEFFRSKGAQHRHDFRAWLDPKVLSLYVKYRQWKHGPKKETPIAESSHVNQDAEHLVESLKCPVTPVCVSLNKTASFEALVEVGKTVHQLRPQQPEVTEMPFSAISATQASVKELLQQCPANQMSIYHKLILVTSGLLMIGSVCMTVQQIGKWYIRHIQNQVESAVKDPIQKSTAEMQSSTLSEQIISQVVAAG